MRTFCFPYLFYRGVHHIDYPSILFRRTMAEVEIIVVSNGYIYIDLFYSDVNCDHYR
jgi:hypothetical protein